MLRAAIIDQALARLAAEGLVELRHHRGASVAYPSLEEARGIFAVRRPMEAHVAGEERPRGAAGRSRSVWPASSTCCRRRGPAMRC